MSALRAIPLTGDVLSDSYIVVFQERDFCIRRSGEITYVSDETERKLGTVRSASPSSGSVWTNGDCIAEYYLQDDEYCIIPLEQGFRQLERKTKSHPIIFLLQSLQR